MHNQASATAKVIAAATVFLHTQRPELGLVSLQAAQLSAKFLSSSLRDRLLLLAASVRPLSWLCSALERVTLPGIMVHYARRKRTIERVMLAHLHSRQIQRVYVLGAGFDTLCLRVAPLFPNIHFVELDHPATQSVKMQALAHSHTPPSNLEFRASDLRTTPAEKLFTDCGNRLVIAEGLMMYFTAQQVKALLAASLKTNASPDSDHVCFFSYMEQVDELPAGFRPRSWIIDRWLAHKNEPFLWSANATDLATLVASAGGKIENQIVASDFDGSESINEIRGENIVVTRSAKIFTPATP